MPSSHLTGDDVRALLRLAGECRDLAKGGEWPLDHVMTRLASLTHSQVGIWLKGTLQHDEVPAARTVVERGWSSDSDRSHVWNYVLGQLQGTHPLLTVADDAPSTLVTITRRDVIPDGAWRKSELRNDVYRHAGIGDSMVSTTKSDGGTLRALIFKRPKGAPAFSDRDRELVHAFRAECLWAETDGDPGAETSLSRRERETLGLLMTGLSEKEVAARLGLSPHTTHDYVKAVYRKTGSRSRAELMARAGR